MAKRNQRKWHEKFLQYMEYIVKHPNYKDMPNKFDDNGNIRCPAGRRRCRSGWRYSWAPRRETAGSGRPAG